MSSRQIPGPEAGNLIIGDGGGSAIATLAKPTTLFALLANLSRERKANIVRDSLIISGSRLPTWPCQSMTWRQGTEMTEHRAFSVASNFDVYFADPSSAWQGGGKENTNSPFVFSFVGRCQGECGSQK